MRVGVSLHRTKICVLWKEVGFALTITYLFQGRCFDVNCKFAHGEHELRHTDDYYKVQGFLCT